MSLTLREKISTTKHAFISKNWVEKSLAEIADVPPQFTCNVSLGSDNTHVYPNK